MYWDLEDAQQAILAPPRGKPTRKAPARQQKEEPAYDEDEGGEVDEDETSVDEADEDVDELTAGQTTTLPDVDVDYDVDIERIHYTAGTTGRPKGGVMTFGILYNIITNILINLDRPIGPEDTYLSVGPLTHAAGLMMMVYYCRGSKSIILPRFDPELVLETIERERVTSVLFVPTMLAMILRSPRIKDFDLSSINRIWYGTAPMPVE